MNDNKLNDLESQKQAFVGDTAHSGRANTNKGMEAMELSIAKEKYRFSTDIKSKLSKEKWIEFIEMNLDYFIWLEDTKSGKDTLTNIDKIPESFRVEILKGHSKSQACAELNAKKGYYEIIIDFIDEYDKVATTIMKPISKTHLRRLLAMANYLDGYLLNNGNEIIDEKFIESLS